MLHICFLTLKFIAWLFLVLLLFLVLVLLAVLFVPVRYRGNVSIYEQINAKASVSWLLHIIHLSIRYEKDAPVIIVRLFGLRVWPRKKPKKAAEKKQTHPQSKEKQKHQRKESSGAETPEELPKIHEELVEEAQQSIQAEPKEASEPSYEQLQEENEEVRYEELPAKSQIVESTQWESEEESSHSFFERISELPERVRAFFQRLVQSVRGLWEKLKDIRQTIRTYWEWWCMEDTRLAFVSCRGLLWMLLRHIAPRKLCADVRFGTGDPASTGQLLGAIAIVYSWTKGAITVTPEFEDKVLEGKLFCAGRISFYKFVQVVWKLYRDPHVRAAYRAWQTIK